MLAVEMLLTRLTIRPALVILRGPPVLRYLLTGASHDEESEIAVRTVPKAAHWLAGRRRTRVDNRWAVRCAHRGRPGAAGPGSSAPTNAARLRSGRRRVHRCGRATQPIGR